AYLLDAYGKATDFKGRYVLLTYLEGMGAEAIRGKTVYREEKDFTEHAANGYQYSPYLLEALLHLVATHAGGMETSGERLMIPLEIERLVFYGKARQGEEIVLEARKRAQGPEDISWDARCLDSRGNPVMWVYGIGMHWISA
ncbi:polyketide synthase dehydratase domain-containing protein, partial [Thermodesulfobacteriota bacterium]